MKINGSKVVSFLGGSFICEDGTSWYFNSTLEVTLEEDNKGSVNVIELSKLGYSADDLVKLKQQGII